MDQQDGTETETEAEAEAETETEAEGGEELRCFARVTFPAFNEMSVELGTLGTPPAESVPLNISRGGMQTRTGATMFDGSEGDELLISFTDAEGRLVPDRVLGWIRRVEKSHGYYLISIEFAHPLERVSFQ